MIGSHDKSDWILIKTDEPETEIWSSKNDTVNKTICPNLSGVLKTNTNYTIKARYHDATNDLWSDYGSKEFTTVNEFLNPDIDPYVPTQGIHFIGANTASNVNFFKLSDTRDYWKPDASNFEVVINDEVTGQSLYSLTYKDGDDVLIRSKNGTKFPYFNTISNKYIGAGGDDEIKDYIKEILEPLPLLWKTETEEVTNFKYCFGYCTSLTSIPSGLFDNNVNATDFTICFRNCTSLTSIPSGLFDNNINVTNFAECFYNCISLTPVVHIGSSIVTNANYFTYNCKSKGTVYVPAGSTTATTFRNTSTANANVIEE